MTRRGPKPQAGKREANGRLSRKKEDVTMKLNGRLEKEERETLRTGVEARARMYGLNPGQLLDSDAGSFVGRLFITGLITDQQCEAATQYLRIYRDMQAAVGGPKPSGAVDLNATKGMPGAENIDRAIQAREDWTMALKALQSRQDELRSGASLIAALDHCVLRDGNHPHMLEWLKEGLTALAKHLKIGDKRKAA